MKIHPNNMPRVGLKWYWYLGSDVGLTNIREVIKVENDYIFSGYYNQNEKPVILNSMTIEEFKYARNHGGLRLV